MSGSTIKLPTLKQIIASILAALMMLSSVITGGKLGKIEIAVVGEVTTESEELTLEVRNYSLKEIGYGEDFVLEVKNGEDWETVPVVSGFHSVYVVLRGLSVGKEVVDIVKTFGGKLEAGEYRLTREIKGTAYSTDFTVTAPAA